MSAGLSASGPPSKPPVIDWRMLPAVALGGALGTLAREGLGVAFPAVDGVPVVIFAINLAGAFLLGVLVEALARRGEDEGRRRTIRLSLGTGLLGGFTTYSALANDSALLLLDGRLTIGVGYALATVVIGAAMTVAGIAVAAAHHRWTTSTRAEPDL